MRQSDALRGTLPDSPLPPCPETPNCVRTTTGVEAPPDRLYRATQEALEELGPVELRLQPDAQRAEAVYRVALLFKDDVHVAVESHPSSNTKSVLHVRSASRVGTNDFGVNRRRVERLLKVTRRQLR